MFTWKEESGDMSHPLNALILAVQLDKGIDGKKREFYDQIIIEFVRLHPNLITKELEEALAKWIECIGNRNGCSVSELVCLMDNEQKAKEDIIDVARSIYYSSKEKNHS